MDFAELIESHIDRDADITIAAQPVSKEDAPGMGIFRFDAEGQIVGFEEKPKPERLRRDGLERADARRRPACSALDKPFVASMGIYVFSHDVLYEVLARDRAIDFGREIIPHALAIASRAAVSCIAGFWADVGTVTSFYDVNLMFTRARIRRSASSTRRGRSTRTRASCPRRASTTAAIDEALIAEGAYLDNCEVERSVVGIRTTIQSGAKVTRSILLGADYYEDDGTDLPLGIGRDAVLDRVIVDKNARIGDGARLVNDRGIQDADGDGYYIRERHHHRAEERRGKAGDGGVKSDESIICNRGICNGRDIGNRQSRWTIGNGEIDPMDN